MAIRHSRQFNNYGFTEFAQDDAPDRATRVTEASSIVPTAKAVVYRPSDKYEYHYRNFDSSGPGNAYSTIAEHMGAGSHALIAWGGAERRDKFEEKDGQGRLFAARRTAPKLEVLFAHEDLRPHAMGLLGRAAVESHARYGQYPEASSDLSQHSEKIVSRMAEKGLIKYPENLDYPPDEDGKIDNGISDDDSFYRRYREGPHYGPVVEDTQFTRTKELPGWHHALGRQFIRHALRPERAQPSRVEQPPLF